LRENKSAAGGALIFPKQDTATGPDESVMSVQFSVFSFQPMRSFSCHPPAGHSFGAKAGHPPPATRQNWHGICALMAMMNEHIGRQRHILVVDDEPLVRYTVHMLLEDDGFIVEEAESGPQALAIYAPGKFDMVFTDYCMPEMKGDQLAAAIKQRSPKQPIVMITAFPEKLTSSDCPLGGVDSFICKPFEAEALRAAIARYAPR
jgi:CheY-like chemotaxis protein